MTVAFLAADLAKWEHLAGPPPEALVLTFFEDERPLRGVAGLCDWRLAGRLSRLLLAGRVAGRFGEVTLYPPPPSAGRTPRLPFERLVLFGLGEGEAFDEARAREAAGRIGALAQRLRLRRWALVPPGRSTGRLAARRALELVLDALPPELAEASPELLIVESTAGQKEAAELASGGRGGPGLSPARPHLG